MTAIYDSFCPQSSSTPVVGPAYLRSPTVPKVYVSQTSTPKRRMTGPEASMLHYHYGLCCFCSTLTGSVEKELHLVKSADDEGSRHDMAVFVNWGSFCGCSCKKSCTTGDLH